MLAPLKVPTFRHLYAAQVVALLGTGVTTVALALLAYDLAGDRAGTVLGTALALKMVAYVAIAPVFNGIAGNLPRKKVLVCLDLIRAGFVGCLPFVSSIWQIYVIIFLMQSCSAGFTPMFQATIPDIVPDEDDYTTALSLSRLAYDLESLISPVLAALALLFVSFNFLFAFNGVAFALSALLVVTTAIPQSANAEGKRKESTWEKVSFGIRAYLKTPRLRGLLACSLAVASAGAMVIVNTVVIVRGGFVLAEKDVAIAMAAYGSGSMLVALALPKILNNLSDRPVMLVAAGILAGGLIAGSFVGSFFWLLPIWFLLGCAASAINTPTGRLLRRSSAPEDKPAYFAAQFSLSHACWLITYPLVGWLGAVYGIDIVFCVMAGIIAVAFVAALLLWPKDDTIELTHRHTDLPENHPHIQGAEPIGNGYRHSHPFVIDKQHKVWPREEK